MATFIQEGSLAMISIVEETTWGTIPTSPTFLEVGITGESLKSGITYEKSEQLSSNPYTSDVIITGGDAGGDINLEWYYGAEIDLLLEHCVRNDFVSAELKSGRQHKSLTIMKTFWKEDAVTNIDYTGMRVNTASITANADQGKITGTVGFMGKQEIVRPDYLFYNGTTVPPDWLGRDQAIWYKSDSKTVYQWTRAAGAWGSVLTEDVDNTATWVATALAPSPSGGSDGDWHVNTATGVFSKKVAVDGWTDIFTVKPADTTWYSGTSKPSDATGNINDLYIDTATKKIYQKIDTTGDDDGEWVNLTTFDGTGVTGLWYAGRTVTAKTDARVFSSPELRTIVFTDFDNDLCFTELTININNNIENLKGLCTATATYPHVSNIGSRYGAGDYTVTLNAYFSSQEMYNKYKSNQSIAFYYSLTDGTSYYKLEMGSGFITDGAINTGGNNTTVSIPFQVMLTDDNTDEAPLVITKGTL